MKENSEEKELESSYQQLNEELKTLKEKCTFLERVINEVPANIYISNLETGPYWCNKTNEETLGFTLAEITEMGGIEYIKRIVHADDQVIADDSIQHYQNFQGPEFGGIFRAKHKNEEHYKWFMGWAKAFTIDPLNQVKDIICVDVDMSPQMNTERQLIEALKENLKTKNKLLIQSLGEREVEILSLICKGFQTKEIAANLYLSIHTINTHRRNIQQKLGTTNLADLVTLGREAGLG